ncbi:MAG: hypothetical protein KJ698_08565 [Actinobacteria bacterium]|nr:hypothetical protein [Actinomycetota bacterium]MBU1492414.1 hypothetical protein [Actinomycetota bacterium]
MMRERFPLVRPLVAAVTLLGGLLGAAALLSDRVPVWLGIARSRVDAPDWFPWALDDTNFHLALWFGLTLLATLAVRTTRARLLVGATAAVVGPVVEYLQLKWTFTRQFEMSDVMANTRGVYLGLLVGLVAGAVADALEARRSPAAPDGA